MASKIRVGTSLDRSTVNEVDRLAASLHRSRADVIRFAIDEYLKRQKGGILTASGIPLQLLKKIEFMAETELLTVEEWVLRSLIRASERADSQLKLPL